MEQAWADCDWWTSRLFGIPIFCTAMNVICKMDLWWPDLVLKAGQHTASVKTQQFLGENAAEMPMIQSNKVIDPILCCSAISGTRERQLSPTADGKQTALYNDGKEARRTPKYHRVLGTCMETWTGVRRCYAAYHGCTGHCPTTISC